MSSADMIWLIILCGLAAFALLGMWWDQTPHDDRIFPWWWDDDDW